MPTQLNSKISITNPRISPYITALPKPHIKMVWTIVIVSFYLYLEHTITPQIKNLILQSEVRIWYSPHLHTIMA